jgi:O-antigen biosynthesis protein
MAMTAPPTLLRRSRQVRHLWREQGATAVANRVARRMARTLPWSVTEPWPVNRDDLLAADLTQVKTFSWRRVRAGTPLWINVIITPPAPGSGGHTTVFRLVNSLESQGHRVRLYLDDLHGSDATWYAALIARWWPDMRATVHHTRDGMGDADAVVATAWPTAYRAYLDPCAGKRFYLVQDFEPWFHPPGSFAAFAEATYRMGFHTITAGTWLAQFLHEQHGVEADSFEFGTDERYRLSSDTATPRSGVVFHARHDTARRAYELGMLTLEVFARQHPNVPIVLYGGDTQHVTFPHRSLGVVTPEELATWYQRSAAGLSLSFTNASLVPHEMLAAGCIPIVNDAAHNRQVLSNDHVRYCAPDPHSLARAIAEVVTDPHEAQRALEVSNSVATRSWRDAGDRVCRVFERELWW